LSQHMMEEASCLNFISKFSIRVPEDLGTQPASQNPRLDNQDSQVKKWRNEDEPMDQVSKTLRQN
jgi:hypothetical protein